MDRKQYFVSAVLTALLAVLTACGEQGNVPAVSSVPEETKAETEAAEAAASWKSILPQEDFGGADFTVLIETNANTPIFERYWSADADSGDILTSAVYQRNRNVGDYYNITLSYLMHEDIGNWMYQSILSGENAFQLAAFHMASASGYILKDAYLNWLDISGVDFSHPWWSASNTEDLAYHGVLFTAIGDYAVSSLAKTYCMFFNKNKAADYDLGNLYDIVRAGDWTMEYLRTMTKDIYTDVNQDGNRDDGDLYGFVTPPATALIVYNWALGGQIFRKNTDGYLENVYMNDRTVKMFEAVYSLLYDNAGAYTSRDYRSSYGDAYHNMGRDFLLEGKAVFINGEFDDAMTHLPALMRLKQESGWKPVYPRNEERSLRRSPMPVTMFRSIPHGHSLRRSRASR